MKTYIYFVRHGEVNNPNGVCYQRLPGFDLTEKGRKQIEKTAGYLSGKEIEAIYASPLLRTRQSAGIIKNVLKLPAVYFSKDILEVKTSLQGKPLSYVNSLYNVFPSKTNLIKGETIEDIAKRMERFVLKIIKIHKGKNIVAVSHGDPIMITKALLKKLPLTIESIRPGKDKYIKLGGIYTAGLTTNSL